MNTSLSSFASLLHDLGKASVAFQSRLSGELKERNQYRHEWVSLRLFQSFVNNRPDSVWLSQLVSKDYSDVDWLSNLQADGVDRSKFYQSPFKGLRTPLAQVVGWLILSHHRLPTAPNTDAFNHELDSVLELITSEWNEVPEYTDYPTINYWTFPNGLPVSTVQWKNKASRVAIQLMQVDRNPLEDNFLTHMSRLSLMLADHYYSSLSVDDSGNPHGKRLKFTNYPVYANTYKDTSGNSKYNQTLDEHLIGVARGAIDIADSLSTLKSSLPNVINHSVLINHTDNVRFEWQNKSVDKARMIKMQSDIHGAFIVNMASTGQGKTLANARIMNALSGDNFRCVFAMGLRTLTLQTGQSFKKHLQLSDSELAIRVGGTSSREMFDFFQNRAANTGSESTQALTLEQEESGYIDYSIPQVNHAILDYLDDTSKRFIISPITVCTIDHITPATESVRGGRQITPMLKLFTSDLVLDEPDDFDIADLPALTRLVNWAGMLGCRVLLSSATLTPHLIKGLYLAYKEGRKHYQKSEPKTPCLFVDEFNQQIGYDFDSLQSEFADARFVELHKASKTSRRIAEVIQTDSLSGFEDKHQLHSSLANLFVKNALELHQSHNQIDPTTKSKVSFGLIRMANIKPLIATALEIINNTQLDNTHIHLCIYHSQYPLLIRSEIERTLDDVLSRHNPDRVFTLPIVRNKIDSIQVDNHVFIVLGSPVTEVGRDHDYDWAICEPSSMRSLIQLAGRVKRHRQEVCVIPNIRILDTNVRKIKSQLGGSSIPVFSKPGFESSKFKMKSHSITEIVKHHEYKTLDSKPRIVSKDNLNHETSFIDLEHARMKNTMLPIPVITVELTPREKRAGKKPYSRIEYNAASWYSGKVTMTGLLQKMQQFRLETQDKIDACLRLNPDNYEPELVEVLETKSYTGITKQFIPIDSKLEYVDNSMLNGESVTTWFTTTYKQKLFELKQLMGLPMWLCALKFGEISLNDKEQGWQFHPSMGFNDVS